jgi:hypothetical protein
MKHSASAYRNSLCHCQVCTDDATARAGRERAARTARLAADPSLAPHGNVHTYDEADRHTALGDAGMVRDLYAAVMQRPTK